jgi:hypothetical protein
MTTRKAGKARRSISLHRTASDHLPQRDARDVAVLHNGRRVAGGYGVTQAGGRSQFVIDRQLTPRAYRLVVGRGRTAQRISIVISGARDAR